MAYEESSRGKTTFVSYASENRPFAKQLADTLGRYNVPTWYDQYEITLGDSIHAKIAEGLLNCDYGILVLSHEFFAKKWTNRELRALYDRLEDGRLFPVFHRIKPAEVAVYDILLKDIHGISSRDGVRAVASAVAAKVLGTGERDSSGRTFYRWKTLRLADIPLSADLCLEDMVFEDCILQGLAILTQREDRDMEFDEVVFNGPEVFIPIAPGRPVVGSIGLRRVVFRRSRFKDVGFFLTPDQMRYAQRQIGWTGPGYEFPEHLR